MKKIYKSTEIHYSITTNNLEDLLNWLDYNVDTQETIIKNEINLELF